MVKREGRPNSMILFNIIIIGCSLTAAILNVNIQKPIAVKGAAITRTNDSFVSQLPLYIELDKTTSQKAVVVNGTTAMHAIEVTFSGNGTARGVNYTDSGKALIILRENGVINAKGYVTMMTSSGNKASATFQEIGHPVVDANKIIIIIIMASGASFFDANATGKLAFLDNSVTIYKDMIYKDGTDKVIAWEWK
jgi:hypothetical protein